MRAVQTLIIWAMENKSKKLFCGFDKDRKLVKFFHFANYGIILQVAAKTSTSVSSL